MMGEIYTFTGHKKPTIEQDHVCSQDVGVLKIKAFAGAGKTSTLDFYSARRQNKRFLYLAYNNPIAKEARLRFGSNVDCRTTHAMGWESVGAAYDMVGKIGDTRNNVIGKYLGCTAVQALTIKKAVLNYLSSGDEGIMPCHVDPLLSGQAGAKSEGDVKWVAEQASRLWGAMCDPTEKNILLPHDGYLKLWLLSNPNLGSLYDYILVDEAQDSSGAICDFVMKQSCSRILVGDPHQAIYSWRGAVNAMEKFDADVECTLTTSFRYGQDIADVANHILAWKGESARVIGVGKSSSRSEPPAVLCRTNASVLESAISLAAHGKQVFFIGGPESYRFKKIIDVCHLAYGNISEIQDPFYKSFRDFDSLQNYAKESEDVETKQICKMVKTYGIKTIKMAKMATDNAVRSMNLASIVLGTTHRSKGMEFDTVALEEDFIDLKLGKYSSRHNMEEEANLIYVGCTRAKNKLYPSRKLTEWIKSGCR